MKDYYSVLGISAAATGADIKKAYRKKALQFHPDKNPSPTAKQNFIEVTEAYEVLSNKVRRQHYYQVYNSGTDNGHKTGHSHPKWEEEIRTSAEIGKRKGEKLSQNYGYFSGKVILMVLGIIVMEILVSIFFESAFYGLLMPVILLFGGPVMAYVNSDMPFAVILGISLSILGFFWIRAYVKDIIRDLKRE